MFRSLTESKLVLGLLLIALTVTVYQPVARHGFVNYDDDRYVTENAHVRSGLAWSTITWAFTTFEQANWHPLTWISHALDCQIFHLDPRGHHATSLFFHALNVLLLFLVLQWFTQSLGRSWMVAALFAVHPLNVESVAWVAERKSLLSMLFFLLAVAAYGWYVRKPQIGRYLLIVVLFALGLMSKPMVITLPFVLVLLDYWPLGRMRFLGNSSSAAPLSQGQLLFASRINTFWKLCLGKIPLFLLSAGSAVITVVVQRAGGAVVSTTRVPLDRRLGNAVLSYGLYLKKMIWPSGLAVLYPYPHFLPIWKVGVAAIFLVAVTLAVLQYRARRYLVVGWFWYLGTMIPMIGLVQVGNQGMADRYAYLPMIGLFLMIVWTAADWAKARNVTTEYLAGIAFLVVAALSWTTRVQLKYWQDDFSLWTHTLAVNPNNFVAENNLGLALMQKGRRDDAIAHFRTASLLEPDDATSQFNLGVYAQEQGDWKQATERYQLVLQLTGDPQLRASAFANLGTIYFSFHDYVRAKQNFDSVLKLNRAFPLVLRDLGLIAQAKGDWNEAIRNFARLVTLDPTDINYFLLAQVFHQAGRDGDAGWAYQQATRLSKDINQTRQAAIQLQAQ